MSLASVQGQSSWMFQAIVFTALLGTGVFSLREWQQSPAGCLQWDGLHWHWSGLEGSGQCHLDVLMDFQSVLLVRMRGDAHQPGWLWLEKSESPSLQWHALRRALVGSQRLSGAHGKTDAAKALGEDV